MAGKWQLGRELDKPKNFGFDEYCLWQHTRRPPRVSRTRAWRSTARRRTSRAASTGPTSSTTTPSTSSRGTRSEPFFLYYPMMLTHGPYMPTPDSKDWDPKAMGESGSKDPQHFADMVQYMDKLIGKLRRDARRSGPARQYAGPVRRRQRHRARGRGR